MSPDPREQSVVRTLPFVALPVSPETQGDMLEATEVIARYIQQFGAARVHRWVINLAGYCGQDI